MSFKNAYECSRLNQKYEYDLSENELLNLSYKNISGSCELGMHEACVMVLEGISDGWFNDTVVLDAIEALSDNGFIIGRFYKQDGNAQNFFKVYWNRIF